VGVVRREAQDCPHPDQAGSHLIQACGERLHCPPFF
jgi:hypothetical protein